MSMTHEDVYQKYVRSTCVRGEKTCTTAIQTQTNMDTHHHSSHAASAGGALDDADDGVSAAPAARAPAATLCAASAVQVVELEVTAGGRGGSEERPAAAAGWQQQPRVAGAPAAIRTASRTRPDPGSGPTMSDKDGGADLPVRPQVSRPSLQSRFGIVHPQSERRRGNSKADSQRGSSSVRPDERFSRTRRVSSSGSQCRTKV